jgi:hypothetical protein
MLEDGPTEPFDGNIPQTVDTPLPALPASAEIGDEAGDAGDDIAASDDRSGAHSSDDGNGDRADYSGRATMSAAVSAMSSPFSPMTPSSASSATLAVAAPAATSRATIAAPAPASPSTLAVPAPAPSAGNVFERARYRFTTGIAAGESARIRDDAGEVLLGYRSFASIVGVIAALVSGVVLIAGIAAVAFLVAEGRIAAAILALMLSAGFSVVIAMLVPAINVTIFEGTTPVITIAQQSNLAFPSVTHAVVGREGRTLARLRKSVFARFGRNRWTILSGDADRKLGHAEEESFGRAILRKLGGKFNRSYEANVRIHYLGANAGWIVRRPEADAAVDLLDLTEDSARLLDRRVAVALATLILGSEP